MAAVGHRAFAEEHAEAEDTETEQGPRRDREHWHTCAGRPDIEQWSARGGDQDQQDQGDGHQMGHGRHASARDQPGAARSHQTTDAEDTVKGRHDRPAVAFFDGDRLDIHRHIEETERGAEDEQGKHR
jgi:hypothetical protein